MQGTTLAIGILCSILVLSLRPVYALAVYIAALVWYPDYLRVSIGTLDISVGRIVVTLLFLKCLCNDQLRRKFVWSRLDTWVALSMAVFVGIYCLTHSPLQSAVENQGGFLMDTWLVYLAVRLCIPDRATMITAVKFIAIILAPLALLGVFEAVAGQYVYRYMHQYCPWRSDVPTVLPRWGYTRAQGPFSHSIMFGSCFVMFLPLIWALRHQSGNWRKLAYLFSAIAVIGALSSFSSGPWGMLTVVVFCLVLGKYKRWTKPVLMWLVVLCVLAEVGSNRALHHVLLSYLNFGKGDWYQRARLIDAAIEHVDEWWLAGYGDRYRDWGQGLFDCNNEFILKGVLYGVPGIAALCAVLVEAFRELVRAENQTKDTQMKSLYWSLGSALVGVIVIWQGVIFFGQLQALFYCLLGMIGSSFGFTKYASVDSRKLIGTSNGNLILAYGQVEKV